MQKSPLTNTEIAKLQAEISDLKDQFPIQTLAVLGVLVAFIFLPGKGNRPSVYHAYGFWKPVLLLSALVGAYSYYTFRKKVKALQADLDSGEKVVENTSIWKKQKTRFNGKHKIYLMSAYKEFSEMAVDAVEFERFAVDQPVTLAFGERSKMLFELS